MSAGTFELTRVDGLFAGLLDAPVAALIGPRTFAHVAPDDMPAPIEDQPDHLLEARVVWTLVAPATDTRVILTGPGSRIGSGATYAVKAVGPVDAPTDLEALADVIDSALHGTQVLVPDSTLRAVITRTSPLLYPELVDGRLWWHVGGLYALNLSNA